MLAGVRAAGELAAADVYIEKLVYAKENMEFFFWTLNGDSYGTWSNVRARIGVDLGEFGPSNVEIDGGSITLDLPPVKLVSFSFTPDLSRPILALTRDGIGRLDPAERAAAFRDAELQVRLALGADEFRDLGEDAVRGVLTAMLEGLGYELVTVRFQPSESPLGEVEA